MITTVIKKPKDVLGEHNLLFPVTAATARAIHIRRMRLMLVDRHDRTTYEVTGYRVGGVSGTHDSE